MKKNQNHNNRMNERASRGFRVSDLPAEERPRERLLKLGPQFLSSQELLAIIISSGIAGLSAMQLAQNLISKYGSLANIADVSIEELRKEIKGIGVAKISRLKACFEIARRIENEKKEHVIAEKDKITSPQCAWIALRKKLLDYKKEHFFVVSLDIRNRIISVDEISKGTLESSLVHPRETFNTAIRRNAAKIIIAHNHPSEDPQPSEDDINITRRLKQAGSIIGIEVIDHIIICKSSYFSFKEKGFLD
ncbi:MAG: DNA repair protein RadC [Candidatus Omnitrophica bacterium]|nr:DNA repair protein RadC [Candidatus Omnitrophota bacterium]MCM8817678.1 DNA repair protein RadC [Candidatus Omnitrophota bacterium]